ncbi:glycosyltransferase [Agitococcus lubricus]|uniref:Glycosyltransferase involved in cell wall biosynthesis n=1 Tax=Agitococcus lubricus TaxID=1077255 RepID=A0A2T5J0X0_9GAMM|nr:glycosyltransferase [Agitococcus lubricus]PTQ90037.1 glycosyltransferase involved in cell wall biosynthesis [Agitococcus lubricus]
MRLIIITSIATTIRAFLLPYARHYRKLGWQVDAAAQSLSANQELQQEFDVCHELPLTRNPRNISALMQSPAAIRQLVVAGNYDLVHVHTPIAAFLVRFALKGLNKRPKVVYTAHGFHFHRHGKPLTNFIFQQLEKMAAPWCDALITINKEDFQAAKQAGFATRIEYMAGIGVDTSSLTAEDILPTQTTQIRQQLSLKESDVLFLMIAEFNLGKRHFDALNALAQTPSHVHLAFAGVGGLFDEVKNLATQLGIAKRVHFLGFRRDIPVLIRISRAVILPSEREGLPRSLLEAMSLSTPIIGSNIRGVAELAADNCGLLHEVGDSQGLAQAIIYLTEQPILAQQMGQAARQKVLAYDVQKIIEHHDKLYAELLA